MNPTERDDGGPLGLRETLAKMQIAKDKKDHEEMVERVETIARLAEELEKSVGEKSTVSSDDRSKIETVEKLTKKVIDELGGDEEIDSDAITPGGSSVADAIKFLRDGALKMVDEVRKTTRFSISAAAIETSSLVLKAVRALKILR